MLLLQLLFNKLMVFNSLNGDIYHMISTQLEEDYLIIQNDMNKKQLDWEYRVDALESQIQNQEEERDQIILAASSSEVSFVIKYLRAKIQQALPDRSLPVGAQLEACLRLLVDRTRIMKAQEIKQASLEAELFALNTSLNGMSEKLRERDAELCKQVHPDKIVVPVNTQGLIGGIR
jgi:hypothetical protein